jgi:acyl-CoA reductase-like NAD-dependent aldehyde dehydrogenase
VTPFKTDAEAVSYANATQYGLSCSLWTQDLSRAHSVASKINVGTVWVNTWMQRDLNVPFGGMKASGQGREGRTCSEEFFTESKTVCIKF